MNRGELVSFVQEKIGRDDKASAIQTQLNLAVVGLARLHDWRDLQGIDDSGSFTDGVTAYNWPTDFRVIDGVWRTEDHYGRVTRKPSSWRDTFYSDPSEVSKGVPEYYIDLGTSFETLPIPDTTYPYSVRYRKKITDMTTDDAVPTLTGIDDLIGLITAMYIQYSLGMLSDGTTLRTLIYSGTPLSRRGGALVLGLLQQAIEDDKRRPDTILRRQKFLSEGEGRSSNYLSDPTEGL